MSLVDPTILKVALLQCALEWENPAANRLQFDQWFQKLTMPHDLIVLPEMFSTGFTMEAEANAETMDGETVKWMCEHAANLNTVVCGSLIIKESNNFYNRFIWAERGEVKWTYDKRHLFCLAGENQYYTSGSEHKSNMEFGHWMVMPRVCYDLRFPVWNRSTESHLQIYVANWPSVRISAWDALLKARAIENQCYVIGLNRVGNDAKNHHYPGHSIVYNALGEPLTQIANDKSAWILAELDLGHLKEIRKKLAFGQDADSFSLII